MFFKYHQKKMVIKHKTEEQNILSEFEQFIDNNKFRFKSESNIELIRKAFKFSLKAHSDMRRLNGDPYIIHCLNVAKIVTEEFGLGTTSAISALIHDIPVKTEYTTEDIKNRFNDKIYNIIESLIKIKNTEFFENNVEASVFRQILISISDDIRVIFIKIADKLDNIRTIESLPESDRRKALSEILNIYAPIAHRIGLYNVKDEMEDIGLKYSNPYIYNSIKEHLKSSERERLQFINRFIQPLKKKLDENNINYTIYGRPKTVFSIWKKMEKKKIGIDEIYDLFAVRIIFKPKQKEEENFEALQIGSLITYLYPEKKERRRDWLKIPKETGYRALHITVMSNEGQWVEIQIRSEEMHEAAEHGLAAHWKYKGLKEKKTEFDEKIKDLLNYLNEDNSSALTFIDNLKINLLNPEIYVYTPKGEIKTLPNGATVLDFAFKIHTDLGFKCIAGKINGKTQAPDTVLQNGDQVEIITTKNQQPKREWLDFVKTQDAVYNLKRIFREDIKKSIKQGEDIITTILKSKGITNIGKCIETISKEFEYRNKEKFLEEIGEKKIDKIKLKLRIKKICQNDKQVHFWNIKLPFTGKEKDSAEFKNKLPEIFGIADCCLPLPGDKIVGIKDSDTGKIIIHKSNCASAMSGKLSNKTINLKWFSESKISVLKKYKIKGKDEPGIAAKIISLISKNLSVNIKSINFDTHKTNFIAYIQLYSAQDNSENELILQLQKLPGINSIEVIE